jgi:hypothetical protein
MAGTWCKVENGVLVWGPRYLKKDPEGSALDIDGGPKWRPYLKVALPLYNYETHHTPISQPDDIQPTQVTQVWASPVAKTAQEIDIEKTEQADSLGNSRELLVVKMMLSEGYELRNEYLVSQSLPPLSLQEYADKLKAYKDTPVVSDAAFKAFIKDLIR